MARQKKTTILAITGGIASGKSVAAKYFQQSCPDLVSFDADKVVHHLLAKNESVIARVSELFGSQSLTECGEVDRGYLKKIVFNNEESRKKLEAILHPKVREECLEQIKNAHKLGAALFLAEIPLLFESNLHFGQEHNLLVATSRETQLKRLKHRDKIDLSLAESILATQMPMEEKIKRANIVFWNEGPLACLKKQIDRFLHSLMHYE